MRGTQHHRKDKLKTIAAELSWRSSIQFSQMERHSKTQRLSISFSSADLVKTLIPKHIDEMHYTEDVHAIITA